MEEGYSMCYYLAMVCATVWAGCKGVKEDYNGYTLRLEDYPRVIGDGSKRFDSNKIRMRQLTLYIPEKEAGVVELLLHRLLPLRGLLKLPLLLLHLGLEVGSSSLSCDNHFWTHPAFSSLISLQRWAILLSITEMTRPASCTRSLRAIV
ncbi:hypothetical protein BHM03_00049121 [Ensete ventricosum]|nr:hypothetical protein BHM03_00049121 [Ensete ventricosum]